MITNPVVVSLRAATAGPENGPTYTKAQIENSKIRLMAHWEKIKERNYWRQFQKEQAEYIEALKSVSRLGRPKPLAN